MKRYVRCPLCHGRALVEYGNVLREHEQPRIAPGGFDTLPVVMCYGPRPEAPTATDGATAQAENGSVTK